MSATPLQPGHPSHVRKHHANEDKFGYVFTGFLEDSASDEVAGKLRPRSEFHLFAEQRPTKFVTFADLQDSPALPRALASAGKPVQAIAIAALSSRPAYKALVATGENIGFPAVLYALLVRSRIPVNVITHGSFFGSSKMRLAAPMLRMNSRARYLTLSDALRTQMIKRFGFAENCVVNAGYGVDTEFFAPRPMSGSQRPIIMSAGTATRDYRTLVAATHDLDADVRIAADSAWFPTTIDIAADRLPANCEARSYGNYAALRELYASASFAVVPLHPAYHACGLAVIAEAMAMGKPVVTTRIEGRSDFIVEGETGFYVEPGDVTGLREKISLLLDDPARAAEMGMAARRRMAALFSLENYVDRLLHALLV